MNVISLFDPYLLGAQTEVFYDYESICFPLISHVNTDDIVQGNSLCRLYGKVSTIIPICAIDIAYQLPTNKHKWRLMESCISLLSSYHPWCHQPLLVLLFAVQAQLIARDFLSPLPTQNFMETNLTRQESSAFGEKHLIQTFDRSVFNDINSHQRLCNKSI